MSWCVFCDIAEGVAPATRYQMCGAFTVAFTPLNPVTPGHTLVVPRRHVRDATVSPDVTAETMRWAAILAAGMDSANIITSIGAAATQSVPHLHAHVVPRHLGDGLHLPWTGQQEGDSDV